MQNGQFKCPICGSTHFFHIISKTHPEVFGIECSKCVEYIGWLDKELYNSWRKGFVRMDQIEISKASRDYIKLSNWLEMKGFRKLNAYTLVNDQYRIRLDKNLAIKKGSKEKIDLKDFIKTL